MIYNYYEWNQIVNGMKKYVDKKIFLYPGGMMTREIMRFLDKKGDTVDGIIDRNDQVINGIKTNHLNSVKLDEDSVIYITSIKYEKELRNNLKKIGFNGITESFFNKPLSDSASENGSEFYIKRMDLVLTSKCTLRCEKCANLMQYYENPCDVEMEVIKKSMGRLLGIVDKIGVVYVLGGEPFLYKSLDKVISFLKQSQKIQEIRIITNGTICPSGNKVDLWKELSDKRVCIQISDYGKLSRNKDKLIEWCCEHNITCVVDENKFFYDTGDMNKRNRDLQELKKVFADCSTQCRSLYNGEFHFCPRSSHGVDLGFVEKRNEDFVDLLGEYSDTVLRDKLLKFLGKDDYIAACDYCDIRTPGYYEKTYPAAVQSRHVLKRA